MKTVRLLCSSCIVSGIVLLSLSVPLSSETPRTHSATLKWTGQSQKEYKKNPKARIEKYFVYRSEAQRNLDGGVRCDSNFRKIGETDAPKTLFVDTAVESGHAYCYQVRAFRAGLESAPSVSTTAIIP